MGFIIKFSSIICHCSSSNPPPPPLPPQVTQLEQYGVGSLVVVLERQRKSGRERAGRKAPSTGCYATYRAQVMVIIYG